MPIIQATVEAALLHKIDKLAAATGRTRSNYVSIVLKAHVKEMPPAKVIASIQAAWKGVENDKKTSR